jgi:hypothetical protein
LEGPQYSSIFLGLSIIVVFDMEFVNENVIINYRIIPEIFRRFFISIECSLFDLGEIEIWIIKYNESEDVRVVVLISVLYYFPSFGFCKISTK